MKKKTLISIIAVALVICVSIGGVLAYLTAKTGTITNTFTVGDINLTLTETTGSDYKMVPGDTLDKNPTVTVAAGSEDSYVYVKVEKVNDPDKYLNYTIDEDWRALQGVEGVYYREVAASDVAQVFSVLTDDQVVVKEDLTKEELGKIGNNKPQLKFTAYAIQKANTGTAAEAWAKANF